MHTHIYQKITILLIFSLFLFGIAASPTHAASISDDSFDNPTTKEWTISFNKPVDPSSVHSNSVYVTNQAGNKVNTTASTRQDKVIVSPPTNGYTNGETYTLHITDVRNANGVNLKESVHKNFTIEKIVKTYDVVNVLANGTTAITSSFNTYGQAVANKRADQAIQFDGVIITMLAGIVVTKQAGASSLTIIYEHPNFRTNQTYVPADTELEYVSSTDAYVEIKLAGKTGFIQHENSTLKPWAAVKDRSYYSTRNGVLTHSIYSNRTGTFSSYQAGVSPSFMTDDVRYYSWDGFNFTDANGARVGTAYQYFQFLPVRSETHYSAAEIDAYIMLMLRSLEKDYPGNKTYQNASTKSKLIGIGAALKRIEAKYKVNALQILALAQHESAYGLSDRAQQYNNLFGLYVTDDNPAAKYFDTVEKNIEELITAFWNKNYIPPNAAYANGAIFGNKAVGMNIKYASDPYWGAKAAGHLYRIDAQMGGRDFATAHKIALTTEPLNIRTGAGTTHSIAYRYKTRMPVIITGPATPSPWVKVISDSSAYNELFAHSEYLQEIPIAR